VALPPRGARRSGGSGAPHRHIRYRPGQSPARDRDLAAAWLAVLIAAIATLILVVLDARGFVGAGIGIRVSVGAIAAELGAVMLIASHRMRAQWGIRELASSLVALFGLVAIVGPL
jgi:hypothetical protein